MNEQQIKARLMEARRDLTKEYKQHFIKAKWDLPNHRLIGKERYVLQWEPRHYSKTGTVTLIRQDEGFAVQFKRNGKWLYYALPNCQPDTWICLDYAIRFAQSYILSNPDIKARVVDEEGTVCWPN